MKFLISGGAGFIGTNLVARLLKDKHEVWVMDDLSRKGSSANLKWLKTQGKFSHVALHNGIPFIPDVIVHLAAQVAVTDSIADPRKDFWSNTVLTFELLELLRKKVPKAIFINASTNKVYGEYPEPPNINPQTPYGVSKAAAELYVIDYAKTYGLKTVSLRQSCIYGPRQNGTEDQGWVSHFVRQAVKRETITIYGDGGQVRDLLHVDDLIECYLKCVENIDKVKGMALDIGGGPSDGFSANLEELILFLGKELGHTINIQYDQERKRDQHFYQSKIYPAAKLLGWKPTIPWEKGVRDMIAEYSVG